MVKLDKLRAKLNMIKYPESIASIIKLGEYSNGEGFFPGYSGNFNNQDKKSKYKYLILGQDLNNQDGFEKTSREGNELKNRTFKKPIKKLLKNLLVAVFTNHGQDSRVLE